MAKSKNSDIHESFVERYQHLLNMFGRNVLAIDADRLDFGMTRTRARLIDGAIKSYLDDEGEFKDTKKRNISDNIEIIEANGIFVRNVDPILALYYNLTDSCVIERKFETALNDTQIDGIMYKFSSPGGVAQGLSDHASFVNRASNKKPVLAYTDDLEASAAFYAASACSERSCAKDAFVGSVGSIMLADDITKMLSDIGIVVHEFTTGKMKTAGHEALEFTKEKKEYLQSEVDWFGNQFFQDVSGYMGIPVDELQAHDGRCYIGRDALVHSFVDRIETFDNALSRFSAQCVSQKDGSVVIMSKKTEPADDAGKKVNDNQNQIDFVLGQVFALCDLSEEMQNAIKATTSPDYFVDDGGIFDIAGYSDALSAKITDFKLHIDNAVSEELQGVQDAADIDDQQTMMSGVIVPIVDDVNPPPENTVALFYTGQGVLMQKTSDGQSEPVFPSPQEIDEPQDAVLGFASKPAPVKKSGDSYTVEEIKAKMGLK